MWRGPGQVKKGRKMRDHDRFETLVWIMDRLRDPDEGCPWDREQDYASLRGYLLEECYEVAEALDRQDLPALREELGDLLFQIVFLSRLAQEERAFTAADVVRGISEKMIRRHPHVFGSATAETADDVLRAWEEIKRREKRGRSGGPPKSVLDGIPRALPALLKAQRLGTKAARVGFDWPDDSGVLDKLREELDELREALQSPDEARADEEIGDLLFTVVMLARRRGVDAERALEAANRKFVERFRHIEDELARRGVPLEQAGAELLNEIWDAAKRDG